MRHRKTIDKLGRTAAHRKATLANLSVALFERKHIQTTEAKAKATRRFAEKLITLAKKDTVHARRIVMERLRNRKTLKVLFDDIVPQYKNRQGGYTRVIKLGQRQGDGAKIAVLELVGFEMASKKKKAKEEKADTKKKKRKDEADKESIDKAEQEKKDLKPSKESEKKTKTDIKKKKTEVKTAMKETKEDKK